MKKIFTLVILLSLAVISYGQNKYLSAGVSYSGGKPYYSFEGGFHNDVAWLGTEISVFNHDNHYVTYAGAKICYKIDSLSKNVDFYAFTGISAGFVKNVPLMSNSGLSILYKINKQFGIQWEISAPIFDNDSNVTASTGLALNYFF
jgi:hypothetical protein